MKSRVCIRTIERPNELKCFDANSFSFDGEFIKVESCVSYLGEIYEAEKLKSFYFTYGDIEDRKTMSLVADELDETDPAKQIPIWKQAIKWMFNIG